MLLDAARPGVRARAAAVARLPRALHVRPAHLPADQRRRLAATTCWRRASTGFGGALLSLVGISVLLVWLDPALAAIVLAGFVPLLLAHPLVPAPLAGQLPAHPQHGGPADRAVRRVDERHPRGAGVTAGSSATSRSWTGSTPPTATPTPRRSARSAWYVGALRGVGNLTLALVLLRRRAAGGRRCAGAGRAHRVPALPAPVLRPARRAGPVLQRLPVRGGGAGEDRRGARHRRRRARAGRAGRAARRRCVASCGSTGCGSPTVGPPSARVLPEFVADRARPGRRWPWSAPPGRASRRWPSWPRGSTTRPRARSRLDGVDLRDIADAELRSALVMITQEAFLFSGSVADNIALGRPGAPRAAVVAAAEAVGARPFVEALPDGFDTDVRKRGGRLSAGQRQLVSGWPGWCWRTRRWCCWTRPPRRWTCRPSGRCRRRWRRCSPTARR